MIRSATRIAAVLGLVGSVVAAGVALAPAALAYSPGQPVTLPASWLANQTAWLDTLTPTDRVKIMRLAQGGATVPTSKVPGGWKAGLGRFGAAATGFSFGWSAGSWFAGQLGLPPASDLWTDPVAPEWPPEWVPNEDQVPSLPGWVGPTIFETPVVHKWDLDHSATFMYTAIAGPAYRSPWGNNASFPNRTPIDYEFSVLAGQGYPEQSMMSMWVYCQDGSGVVSGNGRYGSSPHGGLASPRALPSSGSTANCTRFDHVEIDTFHEADGETTRLQPGPNAGKWYPEGHASWQPGAPGDPERQWLSKAVCVPALGGAEYENVTLSTPFKETDEAPPSYPDASCNAGDLLTRTELWEVIRTDPVPGGEGAVLITEWEAPDVIREWVQDFPGGESAMTYCATHTCAVTLWRVDVDPALDCLVNPGPCTGWKAQPAERYECRWGTAERFSVLDDSECFMYDPGKTDTETCAAGIVDPVTGQCVPREETDPPPPADPPGSEDCPPAFGLSALTPWWWFKSATCAMVEVFVPQTGVATRVQELTDTAEQRAPFSWVDSLLGGLRGETEGAAGAIPPGGGACPDWRVHVGSWQSPIMCGTSMSDAIVSARPFLAAGALALAFAPLGRSLFYSIIPVFRPTPTSSDPK